MAKCRNLYFLFKTKNKSKSQGSKQVFGERQLLNQQMPAKNPPKRNRMKLPKLTTSASGSQAFRVFTKIDDRQRQASVTVTSEHKKSNSGGKN